jgi:cbb3-type cytochrome oxidase maturation protein
MSVLFIVLPLALLFSAIAVAAFLWALRRGQFDDLNSPAHRVLHDDAGSMDEPAAARPGAAEHPGRNARA